MSDAQFVAASPDSDAVEGARRTLREIREASPDLLVINGDLVDEASPEDFALAQRILEEEWTSDIPSVYVPGNHEVMGGDIAHFEEAFGPTSTAQDLGATKVITMNSAPGTLAGDGLGQLEMLEEQLGAVAESDALTGVVVFFHHPTDDPLPSESSQLSDQREARAIEEQLAEFRRTTGKSVALVNAHAGVFHGAAVEGVTTLVNGNSGKSPAGTPATGGFTGWTMLGIDPASGVVGRNPATQDRVDWLAAETRPWVDSLAVEGRDQLAVGEVGEVSATLTQDGREVPVAWPVTAQWGGTGVHVTTGGAGDEQPDRRDVVRVDPRTGEMTGLRRGAATVTVTVNGETARMTVKVAGEGP